MREPPDLYGGNTAHEHRARLTAQRGTSRYQAGAEGVVLLYHNRWGNIVLFLEEIAKTDVECEMAFLSLQQAKIILQDEK